MPETWPTVGRVLHFSGGLRGDNPPQDNKVYFHPTIPNQEPIFEVIENFPSIYRLSNQYGLIVGVDFYHRTEEVRGLYPPEWRVYTYTHGTWLGFDVCQKMAEIRNNAYQQKQYDFVDCIGKVEAWTKAASRALRGISDSYHMALRARCIEKEYKSPQAFSDFNSDYVNDALHNFFYYVGILRDHIAEFIILYIASSMPKEVIGKPIMSKLRDYLNKSSSEHSLGHLKQAILQGYSTSEHSDILPGWLYLLKEYRNIITHEKPIDMIACRAWTWQLTRWIGGYSVPYLKFPIPLLPLDSTEDYFPGVQGDLKEKLKRVGSSQEFMLKNPDGLELAWRLFLRLLIFLNQALDMSPVKPKIISFDRSNSWGFRVIKPDEQG